MPKRTIRQSDLEAYLDEALLPDEMVNIELALRKDPNLLDQLSVINARRDAGVHSLGEVWRRNRLTCLSREQLGSYLMGTLSDEVEDYAAFHLKTVGCRYCQANLRDLELQQAEKGEATQTRRRRYFQSSAGLLRKE